MVLLIYLCAEHMTCSCFEYVLFVYNFKTIVKYIWLNITPHKVLVGFVYSTPLPSFCNKITSLVLVYIHNERVGAGAGILDCCDGCYDIVKLTL